MAMEGGESSYKQSTESQLEQSSPRKSPPSSPPSQAPNRANGLDLDSYSWVQSLQDVNVNIPVPDGTKVHFIVCDIKKDHLTVGLKGQPPIIDGELHRPVKGEECFWTLEDQKSISVLLTKQDQMDWWKCLLKGEPEIDTQKAEPESMLSQLDPATLKKMMMDCWNSLAEGEPESMLSQLDPSTLKKLSQLDPSTLKKMMMDCWNSLAEGEPEIDTQKVEPESSKMMKRISVSDKNIGIWKVKNYIKRLEPMRGYAISLMIPPGGQKLPPGDRISQVTGMLIEEQFLIEKQFKKSVRNAFEQAGPLRAIRDALKTLKKIDKVPPNGLVFYSGLMTDDGKSKLVAEHFEPFYPLSAFQYKLDNKFEMNTLCELLKPHGFQKKFGVIVVDYKCTLFGTLFGTTQETLGKFTSDIPGRYSTKSKDEYYRLRMEKLPSYMKKIVELANGYYINPGTRQPNVSGLILSCTSDFTADVMTELSHMLDPLLGARIINVVDEMSYGGETGCYGAIVKSADLLGNVRFIEEERLIETLFYEFGHEKYVIGLDETIRALDRGFIETLIIWEDLELINYELRNSGTNETVCRVITKGQEADDIRFKDRKTLAELEVVGKGKFGLEEFALQYKDCCSVIEFVTNNTRLGLQFCKGMGGIGGILHDPLDRRAFDEADCLPIVEVPGEEEDNDFEEEVPIVEVPGEEEDNDFEEEYNIFQDF